MTPEEFDVTYSRLSKALAGATDPVLIRDRLILLALQKVSLADAIGLIDQAADLPADSELRMAVPVGASINRLDHTPNAPSRPPRPRSSGERQA